MENITKEEAIINKYQAMIDNFSSELLELEFKNLLKEYTKLNKKYTKMIKLGDSYSDSIMSKNSKLQIFTKKKVLESVSLKKDLEKKYTKDQVDSQKIIESLTQELKETTLNYQRLLHKNAQLTKTRYLQNHN